MQVETHKQYDTMWVKLDRTQQLQVLMALKLFMTNQNTKQLRIHQLKGKFYPQYSISAAEDLRIQFLRFKKNRVVLMMVGTHDQLYKN
jgi:mRNA-degrading endonuclease YafQ of YafQ-DinJ toxin-antitoxin module